MPTRTHKLINTARAYNPTSLSMQCNWLIPSLEYLGNKESQLVQFLSHCREVDEQAILILAVMVTAWVELISDALEIRIIALMASVNAE